MSAFHPQKRTTMALACFLAGVATYMAAPAPAEACGGTFCDAGPAVMPVDQTGENVMFVVADGQVEAHIQIQYTGDPERFAWIVPVMAEPTVEVGSDLLFTELLDSTVPTFTVATVLEDCDGATPGGGVGGGCGSSRASFVNFEDDDPPIGEGDPTVRDRNLAGSYEYVVLEGGSVAGIVNWLDENGFAQDDDAPPILQEYLDDGFMFVAFKLRSGVGVDQIHPIVLRYEGDEPCVPLRLTRIAARDDMGVRTFFLGRDRVVPTNFRHVQLNPLKLDWVNSGANYDEAVTLAVDVDGADGHAFVTEYAGSSDVLSPEALFNGRWNSEVFRSVTPYDLTQVLADRELMTCTEEGCIAAHPLVPPLLQTYVPPPLGVNANDFYTCSSCYADWEPDGESSSSDGSSEADGDDDDTGASSDDSGTSGGSSTGDDGSSSDGSGSDGSGSDDGTSTGTGGSDEAPGAWFDAWDTDGLADALEEQVVLPGRHALELQQKHPYLTRMYTTLSPSEMTRDPLFGEFPDLPDVDNNWTATIVNRCDGPDRVLFDDGRIMWFTEDDQPPPFADMPYAQIVEEFFNGVPMVLRDHTEAIDAELAAWNEEHAGPDLNEDDDGSGSLCSCKSDTPLRGSEVLTVLLLLGLRSRRRTSRQSHAGS